MLQGVAIRVTGSAIDLIPSVKDAKEDLPTNKVSPSISIGFLDLEIPFLKVRL